MNMGQYVRKILIVEDDLALKPIWEKFFKLMAAGTVIEWAVSCEEAFKMINQTNEAGSSYFLIISDIFLAGSKTGMELINSSEVANSKAKTVLISAADSDEVIEKFGHLVQDTIVISKPFDFKKYDLVFKKIFKTSDEVVTHGAVT